MRRDPSCYRLSKRTALEKFLHLIKRPIADIASVPPVAGVTMEASWISGAARWRSAYRNGLDPSFRYINYGFRVALSPTWRSVGGGTVQQVAKPLGVGTERASRSSEGSSRCLMA